jgi:hypothetical protein
VSKVLIPAAIAKAGTDINFSGLEDFEEIYVQSLKQQVLDIQQQLDINRYDSTLYDVTQVLNITYS